MIFQTHGIFVIFLLSPSFGILDGFMPISSPSSPIFIIVFCLAKLLKHFKLCQKIFISYSIFGALYSSFLMIYEKNQSFTHAPSPQMHESSSINVSAILFLSKLQEYKSRKLLVRHSDKTNTYTAFFMQIITYWPFSSYRRSFLQISNM